MATTCVQQVQKNNMAHKTRENNVHVVVSMLMLVVLDSKSMHDVTCWSSVHQGLGT